MTLSLAPEIFDTKDSTQTQYMLSSTDIYDLPDNKPLCNVSDAKQKNF